MTTIVVSSLIGLVALLFWGRQKKPPVEYMSKAWMREHVYRVGKEY